MDLLRHAVEVYFASFDEDLIAGWNDNRSTGTVDEVRDEMLKVYRERLGEMLGKVIDELDEEAKLKGGFLSAAGLSGHQHGVIES